MKKLFTGASAVLAGLLLASPAAAQGEAETMMVLGGYSSYTVAFTKHPDGAVAEQEGDLAIFNNTEIFFNGSGETDGGLQISARVELEGHDVDGAGQIDEHYVTISGSFGSVEVGANDGADDRFAKGIFYNSSAVDYWYTNNSVVPGDTGAGAGYRNVGISNDGLGLVYTTPSLGGATFAIGYKPNNGNAVGTASSGDDNVISFGAKYEADLDGITFAGSFGYGTYETAGTDATPAVYLTGDVQTGISTGTGAGTEADPYVITPGETMDGAVVRAGTAATPKSSFDVWSIGVNLGFGDTTLYGRWQEDETDPGGGAKSTEREISGLAISHAIGPVKLGLGWVQATKTAPTNGRRLVDEAGDPDATEAAADPTAGELENEDTMLIGSVDYSLGSGITVSGFVAWGETEQTGAVHSTTTVTTVEEVEGTPGSYTTIEESTPTGPEQDADNSESATAFGVALNLAF